MPLSASDLLRNADTFKAAYPSWPSAEPQERAMSLVIDPDCLACVKCHRVIAKVGTRQAHLVDGGRGGVCCDECRPEGAAPAPLEVAPFRYGVVFCGADWVSDYFGGCHAHSRYRVERPGDGYEPAEACPAHLADMIAYLVNGDDVPATVHVRWDEED
jgi:hypothetical protein